MTVSDRFIDWAHQSLLESEDAQAYFRGRGVSESQWKSHKLGYVSSLFDIDPNTDSDHKPEICSDSDKRHVWCDSCYYRSWSASWESPGDGERKIPIVGKSILGCAVLPLTSYSSRPIGFQCRSITTKDYKSFASRRRPEGFFFGTDRAVNHIWSTRSVWLVEGAFDQLIIERLVAPNVLAITTASTSKLQIRFLRRFVDKVYLCLDLDKGGRDGVAGFIRNYKDEFEIVNVKYPYPNLPVKDVNELWKKVGDEKFKKHFAKCIA